MTPITQATPLITTKPENFVNRFISRRFSPLDIIQEIAFSPNSSGNTLLHDLCSETYEYNGVSPKIIRLFGDIQNSNDLAKLLSAKNKGSMTALQYANKPTRKYLISLIGKLALPENMPVEDIDYVHKQVNIDFSGVKIKPLQPEKALELLGVFHYVPELKALMVVNQWALNREGLMKSAFRIISQSLKIF